MLGDKAYSSAGTRAHLRRRGIKATIPEPADQAANRRGSNGGRPPAFDPAACKQRNTVERGHRQAPPAPRGGRVMLPLFHRGSQDRRRAQANLNEIIRRVLAPAVPAADQEELDSRTAEGRPRQG